MRRFPDATHFFEKHEANAAILQQFTRVSSASPLSPPTSGRLSRSPYRGSNVVRFCRADTRGDCFSTFKSSQRPPACRRRSGQYIPGAYEFVTDRLLGVSGSLDQEVRHPVDHVADQVEAIKIIQHAHV